MATETTPAAALALTSTRTNKAMYTASIERNDRFDCDEIVLTGKRGAEYRSIMNRSDGLHRFIEAPVKSYLFAIVDGCVCLPRERTA